VNDNETAALNLVLPATAAENAGVLVNQGRINASAAPSQNITVNLNSSDLTGRAGAGKRDDFFRPDFGCVQRQHRGRPEN